MNIKFGCITLLIACLTCTVHGQLDKGDDPVLFRVEDRPVHVSEFEYIYNKNNGQQADYSEESLREYLDLYIRFKLKVQAARDMKLDTITSLQKELEGYRKQLSKSYLVDKQVINKLTRELYERKQQDVEISHILIKVPTSASPADTAEAHDRAMKAYRALQEEGASFKKVALNYSDDKSVRANKGYLGYYTAKFPDGFYELENAAYETSVGEISKPVRTKSGYHIVKVHDKRPARGTMEIAHILIRPDKDTISARKLIHDLHQKLENGSSFQNLAKQYSDDQETVQKGGYIGSIGINSYNQSFEDAAFALNKDGAYTEPVKSRVGWHIIKRLKKNDLPPYYKIKDRLKAQISNDQRMEEARDEMIDRIQREGQFNANKDQVEQLLHQLDESVLSFRWKKPTIKDTSVLFTLGDKMKYTNEDFYEYLRKNARKRMQLGRQYATDQAIQALYDEFVSESCLDYEEGKLMEKYPEFRSLMREYKEGILLFEATQRKVWNKASSDTTGLKKFYEQNKEDYMWKERVEVTDYEIRTEDPSFVKRCKRYIKKHKPQKVVSKFNKDTTRVTYMQQEYEKGSEQAEVVSWEKGSLERLNSDEKNLVRLRKTEAILPPQPKKLDEARGYVIADYQDHLEKKWIEKLHEQYEVKVNEDVLQSLIRK